MEITSPITGAAVTGLTSPTYTLTSDQVADPNVRNYIVSALGGTQTGVDTHSMAKPFTVASIRPKTFKVVPATVTAAEVFGFLANQPSNKNSLLARKGVVVNGAGGVALARARLDYEIPVGATSADLVSVKAMLSALIGAAVAEVDGMIADASLGTN